MTKPNITEFTDVLMKTQSVEQIIDSVKTKESNSVQNKFKKHKNKICNFSFKFHNTEECTTRKQEES